MASVVQPKYQAVLKLPSGVRVEFEQFSGLRWEDYENNVGRCVFGVPHNDPKLALITNTDQFIQIYIYRNSSLVWQGFVAFVSDDKNKTEFYGLSLLETLKWYRVGYNTSYSSKKIGSEVISPVWDAIAGRSGAALGSLITKGSIENPYDTGTSNEKTVSTTTFDEDFFTLCQQMIAVSNSDSPSGAWVQETVMAISLSDTAPTFSFLRNVGTDKTELVFELDSEISDFLFTKDLRYIRNDVKGLAILTGPKTDTNTQTDSTSQTAYYLREISLMFDVTSTTAELTQKVKNYLKDAKDPEANWYLSFTSNQAPYNGYVMGDNLLVRINRGRVNLNSYFRVVGMEVTVTDQGVELTHPILQQKRT